MKKINLLFIFLILICTTILSGCTKPESTDVVLKSSSTEDADTRWDNILEDGIINVGIKVQELPYIEKKSNGSYNGFLIDFTDAVAKKADIKVNYIEINSENIPALLTDGTIDVIINGYSEADVANSQLKWLEPYIISDCIIVCKNNADTQDKIDLSGKKIGVVDDTLSHITAVNDGNINNDDLIKYSTEKEAINALSSKKVDALVIDGLHFYYHCKYNLGSYKILDEIVHTDTLSFGINKTNVKLGEELQKIIFELTSDGTTEKIAKKWFGKNLKFIK